MLTFGNTALDKSLCKTTGPFFLLCSCVTWAQLLLLDLWAASSVKSWIGQHHDHHV